MTPESSGRNLVSQINVAPLADVMLVLLIIFMVVTPIIVEPIRLQLPRSETARAQPDMEKATVITLAAGGGLYLDNVPLPEELLAGRVAARAASDPTRPVLVKADEAVDYGAVLRVMSVCRQAGIEQVALVTNSSARTAHRRESMH